MLSILEFYLFISIFFFFFFGILFCLSSIYCFPRLDSLLSFLFVIIVLNSTFLCTNTSFTDLRLFNNLICKTNVSNILYLFVLLCTIFVFISSRCYNKTIHIVSFEFIFLLLMFLFNILLLVNVNNLFLFFLLVEIHSICLFIFSSINKRSRYSIESSLKYFVLGSFSSIIMLLGVSLVYICSSFMFFDDLSYFLSKDSFTSINSTFFSYGISIGLVFISVGFLFKIYCAPFHFWISDIYQGSATSSVMIFSTISFFVLFYMFIKLFYYVFYSYFFFFSNYFFLFSIFSLLFGTLGGLFQKKLKRLMAYSSVTFTGYILMCLCNNSIISLSSCFLFMVVYTFGVIGVFTVLLGIKFNKISFLNFSYSLTNFLSINKVVSFFLASFLFSLGGIPPFFGFLGKLEVLSSLINNKSFYLFFFLFVVSIVSFFYYVNIVKCTYTKKHSNWGLSYVHTYKSSVLLVFLFFLTVMCTFFSNFLYLFSMMLSYSVVLP